VQALGTMLPDCDVIVQLPESRVIMATAKPQPVTSSRVTSDKNVEALDVVKSSNTLKQNKRRSSSGHLHEPRSKRLRRDPKCKRETAGATWTESLFMSDEVGRDTAEVVSIVDTEELNDVPLSAAASSIVTSVPLVSDAGQTQTASLKKIPQQSSADSTKLPSGETAAVSSNSTGVSSQPATSGQTLIQRDGVGSTVTVDATEGRRSIDATSSSVGTRLLKSPPAVQRTLGTDFHFSKPESSPSVSVPIVRTTLPLSSSPHVGLYSTTKARFLVPVHTNSRSMTSKSVYRVSPTSDVCKMQRAVNGQNVSVRTASSTAARQCHSGGASSSLVSRIPSQSQSSPHFRPSVDSDLLPGSTVTIRVRPSVTVSSPQRCSASAINVQRHASLPVAGTSRSQCSPRTSLTAPRTVSPQPVRIRINATDLGDTADPTAVMNRVRSILSRTNTIVPGAQIRIRYLPPATAASQSLLTQSGCTPQTTTSEQASPRVSQLDGTVDSDSEAETAAVKLNENMSPSSTDVGTENVHTVYSRRRSETADGDEKPALDSRVR